LFYLTSPLINDVKITKYFTQGNDGSLSLGKYYLEFYDDGIRIQDGLRNNKFLTIYCVGVTPRISNAPVHYSIYTDYQESLNNDQ